MDLELSAVFSRKARWARKIQSQALIEELAIGVPQPSKLSVSRMRNCTYGRFENETTPRAGNADNRYPRWQMATRERDNRFRIMSWRGVFWHVMLQSHRNGNETGQNSFHEGKTPPKRVLCVHRIKEVSVGLSLLELVDEEFDRIGRAHGRQYPPQHEDFLQILLGHKQIFLAGA